MSDQAPPRLTTPSIGPMVRDDLASLKAVIDANDLFPSEMLDEMAAPYLSGAAGEFWLTAHADEKPIALAYCAPERMTEGTWNLLLIAVHPSQHRHGFGAALMHQVESMLQATGERILLVETSGLPAFRGTRAFYARLGYDEEARIRGYYQPGEDKVVFRKDLSA